MGSSQRLLNAFAIGSFVSIGANILVLLAFIPFSLGFRTDVLLQIFFWTMAASASATLVMAFLQRITDRPASVFLILTFFVFMASFVPLYLRLGIIKAFPAEYVRAILDALFTMHGADSLIITFASVLASLKKHANQETLRK